MRAPALVFAFVVVSSISGCSNRSESVADPRLAEVAGIHSHLVRQISFHGCLWPESLVAGEVTPHAPCMPGGDRVHFQTLDVDAPCGDGRAPDACSAPLWLPYQTLATYAVDYGDTLVVRLVGDEIEQDFTAPNPYGH